MENSLILIFSQGCYKYDAIMDIECAYSWNVEDLPLKIGRVLNSHIFLSIFLEEIWYTTECPDINHYSAQQLLHVVRGACALEGSNSQTTANSGRS